MENNIKIIEERAKEAGIISQYKSDYRYDRKSVEYGYLQGDIEQREIDIKKGCKTFCYTACPHKTDPYNCLYDNCDSWKIFRRMLEE